MNPKSIKIIKDSIDIWKRTRISYISLSNGIILTNESCITHYLFNDIIMKEICSYMYSEINIIKLPFLNEYKKKIWNNIEKYCSKHNISFFNIEKIFNLDQLLS
jgi:hypothetical protein